MFIGSQSGTIHQFVDEVDIAPGDENAVDVVVQFDDDGECYGWNNEIYTLASPRDSTWKIPTGKYLLDVEISFSDRILRESFILTNTGSPNDLSIVRTSRKR